MRHNNERQHASARILYQIVRLIVAQADGSDSVCRADQLGGALSNDYTSRHGVAGRDTRHDRRIGDAQVVDAVHLESAIDD